MILPLDLTTIRHRLALQDRSVLPYSAKRIEFNFLLAFIITIGLICWLILAH